MITMPPIDTLKEYCLMTENDFISRHIDNYHATGYQDDYYLYIRSPKKTKILLVAHLDTVARGTPNFKYIPTTNEVESIALDDRLGAWIILEILSPLIPVDILLTTGEESGFSTAGEFTTTKKYNWIAEFDRRGTEAVLYQYDTHKLRKLLRNTGTRTTYGTFSDISLLDHLGIAGINFGTGYNNEHTVECYADIDIVRKQIDKFLLFYYKYKDTKIDHAYTPPRYTRPVYTPLPTAHPTYQDEGETCPSCMLVCTSENDLAYIKHFGYCSDCAKDGGGIAFCELCGEEISSKDELKFLRTHEYICEICYKDIYNDEEKKWKP